LVSLIKSETATYVSVRSVLWSQAQGQKTKTG